jgi:hypothetical protein
MSVPLSRRLTVSAAAAATAALVAVVVAVSPPVSARTVDDRCAGRGPVSATVLPDLNAAGCSLAGRIVTDGRFAMVVPPAGMSVVGGGVSRHGDVRGMSVTNTGTLVRVARGPATAVHAQRGTSRVGDLRACQDRTYNLEQGHRWGRPLRFHINLAKMPKRMSARTVVAQIRAANQNMRTGRNTCHKPRLRTPGSHYLGRTRARPHVVVSEASCGKPTTASIVGFGNLPQDLLGWTCYWYYNSNGRMASADIVMDNGRYLDTRLPRSCVRRYDFEGAVTHEWGHAYGLAHTGSGHANLVMQHELTPCSTYDRTLGLGDWLGMNRLYGHRH